MMQQNGGYQSTNNQEKPSRFRGLAAYFNMVRVGQGTFATVFRAYSIYDKADVALKVIDISNIKDHSTYVSTMREVDLFMSLKHRNVVCCQNAFKDYYNGRNEVLVLVLEYVSGGDLEKFIWNYANPLVKLITERDIWHIFTQICSAVVYIHSKKILHRDLKPANVLLTTNMCVKLTDFGLSRIQNQASGAHTVCGTPYYMSPERINERGYTYVSDVWALGCMLYEMAALSPPFVGEQGNLTSLVQKISVADYPAIPEDVYSEHLQVILESCLCAEVQSRPSATEVYEAAALMRSYCD